jgi:hypothetical protein
MRASRPTEALEALAVRAVESKLLSILMLVLSTLLLSAIGPALAQTDSATAGHDYRVCRGYYALCAASTCTPTGKMITVRVTSGGTAQFPEVECTCPVFNGKALGDLAGGNMQGSCKPPREGGQIWSLFAPKTEIPQEINDWVPTGPKAKAPPQVCPAYLGQGNMLSNCFSFSCDQETWINNVPVVTCHCAEGESFAGTPVPPNTAFATQAGQGDRQACRQHPVSVPISLQ